MACKARAAVAVKTRREALRFLVAENVTGTSFRTDPHPRIGNGDREGVLSDIGHEPVN
jgi:hypothetical protein